MPAGRRLGLLAGGAVLGAALWWREHPSACPYSQRFWVDAPHPFITRYRLKKILEPHRGERLLEIGPGTGYYTLPVAGWLSPVGQLDIVDVQQEMLDHTMGRLREAGIEHARPVLPAARDLPFPDDTFDGAYLVTVLGEVPDQDAALRELGRVVRPGGRIVVGELFGDPHMVTRGALADRAESSGLRVDRVLGGRLWHYTRLVPG